MGLGIEWGPLLQGSIFGNLALSGPGGPGLVDVTVGLLSGHGDLCKEELGPSRIPSRRPVLSSSVQHITFAS